MSTPASKGFLEVASTGNVAVIRIHGLGNMDSAMILRELAGVWAGKYPEVLLDFSACSGVDSTFMGTLLCLTEEMNEFGGHMRLIIVTPECLKLFSMLGIVAFLALAGKHALPELIYERLDTVATGAMRRLDIIRHAHEHLVSADEENKQRFGDFLAAVTREIEQINGGSNG